MEELASVGLEDRGILLRTSENDSRYPNGTLCDYYSIIRNSLFANMRGIIIKHAFLDHASDYKRFLSTDKKLEQLGKADAKAIAGYYALGEEKKMLTKITKKITVVTDGKSENNQYYHQTYFASKE